MKYGYHVVFLFILVFFSIVTGVATAQTVSDADSVDVHYPVSYDLRDYGYITSVKDQGEYSTCWAFAAVSAMESNLLKSGTIKNPKSIDLSELQLAYYMHNRDGVTHGSGSPISSLSGLKGDYVLLDYGQVDKRYGILDSGQRNFAVLSQVTSGIGLVTENVLPYSKASSINNGLRISTDYATDYNRYLVTEAALVSGSDRDAVKDCIITYGAGVMSYYDEEDNYRTSHDGTATYQKESKDTNHCVVIVGWDDTFSRNNFYDVPEGDGAWLVKNSWGTYWGDSGYFWISYYDAVLIDEIIIFYGVTPFSFQDTSLYQYDGSGDTYYYLSTEAGEYFEEMDGMVVGIMKNCFTATETQVIDAVSFTTYNPDLSYEVKITTDSGIVEQVMGNTKHSGYVTVQLDYPVVVSRNEGFEVSVLLKADSDTVNIFGDVGLSLPVDECSSYTMKNEDGAEYQETWYSYSEPGQSYIYDFWYHEWVDISENGKSNMRVKAFGHDWTETYSASEISGNLGVGDAVSLVLEKDGEVYQGEHRWVLADELFSSNDSSVENIDGVWYFTASETLHTKNGKVVILALVPLDGGKEVIVAAVTASVPSSKVTSPTPLLGILVALIIVAVIIRRK